jgi:hypothetical protein
VEQKNLKAYLDLVQKLLACRRGEEWIVLRQNEHLVDEKFIEVMEQVANHLALEGQINGARYLHNWAGQLHHILMQPAPTKSKPESQTQVYAELLQTLLNTTPENVPKILQKNQKLITPQLVTFMQQVADQFIQKGDRQTAEYLQNLATMVNRSWIKTHDFQPSLTKANQLAPDPWDDSVSVMGKAPGVAVEHPPQEAKKAKGKQKKAAQTQPPEPSLPAEKPEVKPVESPQPNMPDPMVMIGQQMAAMTQQLGAIASSLAKLEDTIVTHLKPANPLEYLSILEQAANANWVISSTEVEQLIGVKPSTSNGKDSFERGNWRFIKSGKIGTQTGWRIEKMA